MSEFDPFEAQANAAREEWVADTYSAASVLTHFLFERFTEDEAVAQEAVRSSHRNGGLGRNLDDGPPWHCDEQSDHVAMAPARILRDVGAKRRIVDDCRWCEWACATTPACGNCITLANLAAIYADHEDWREEWKL